MVDVREVWCYIASSLMEDERSMAPFSMTSKNHMARFGKSFLYVELASNVVSHAGHYVSLLFFRHISYPPLPRSKRLLRLRHRK